MPFVGSLALPPINATRTAPGTISAESQPLGSMACGPASAFFFEKVLDLLDAGM